MSEVALWNAVIVRAVEDLFSGTNQERRAAFRWIFENNPDFMEVCDYAGVDPMRLRQKVFNKIINGELGDFYE